MTEGKAWVEDVSWAGVGLTGASALFVLASVLSGKKARELESAKEVERVSDVRLIKGLTPMLVAVYGKVASDAPLEVPGCKDGAVIHTASEEQIYFRQQQESGEWLRDRATILSTTQEAPFFLEDVDGKAGALASGIKLPVVNGKAADGIPYVVVVDTFEPLGKSLLKAGLDYMRGIRVLGTRRTEAVLPVGTHVTAVGELTQAPGGSERSVGLVLRKPENGGPFYLSVKTLKDLIRSKDRMSGICKVVAIGLGVTGVVLVTRKLWRGFMARRRQEKARREVRRNFNALGENLPEGVTSEEELCTLCFARKRDCVYPSCGHMACCYECSARAGPACPICRARGRAIRIYHS
ncbi:unnamed protein product [Pedinophyceae sp. YPF-701]|nr:unnamed protein product [Pedinophyceae sp. YPF-701]